MSERDEILGTAKQLGVGQTRTITCPCCQADWKEQGSPRNWSPERSMSVTRERLGVLYNCFRATCSRGRGFIPTVSSEPEQPKKEFSPNVYVDELTQLPPSQARMLREKFEFTAEDIQREGILWNPKRSTVVFPVRDVRGYTVGYVDRDFLGARDLKAITYWFNDVPKLHIVPHASGLGNTCIIVEDIPSAIKASKYMTAVALLGSHINVDQAAHLSQLFNTAIIALDNDAFLKAIKLRKKYSLYFQELLLFHLTKDIKNMKYKELDKLFEGVTT